MLPLGSRGSKKCSECGITAHTRCEHYVPDFCGLSMEMANQMLAEIKAAAKRKTLESKTNSSSRISKQDKVEVAQEAPLPAIPQQSIDDELGSQISNITLVPQTPSKSPVLVPQTPPTMYNNNATQQPTQQHQPSQQQPYYSPQSATMSMPQPPRIYPQQQSPQMQQQQRPPPPVLPAHGQQSPYGYNSGPAPVDPRYQQQQQQQQQQQMYYQQQQQQMQQQARPPMSYSPYQQPQPQHPQQMMGRPQPNPNYAPVYQQQQQQQYGGMVPPNTLHKQPSMGMMQQQQKRKVALDNFSFLAVLGKGNFGKVMLAEEKFDKKLYAIKMLKKRFIIDNDEIER
jgi:classical protein kinase C